MQLLKMRAQALKMVPSGILFSAHFATILVNESHSLSVVLVLQHRTRPTYILYATT